VNARFYVDHLDTAHIVLESDNKRIVFCDAVVQNCAGCHKPILPLNRVVPGDMKHHEVLAYFQNWMLKTWGIVAVCECPDCSTLDEWQQFKAEIGRSVLQEDLAKQKLMAMRKPVNGPVSKKSKKGGG
jgi:hypothetical protein